jgi:large subunit ribosomal protein L25
MELTVTSREAKKKSDAKKLRCEGKIPAILYSNGAKGKEIAVDDGEFQKFLRSIPKGTLSSKIIILNDAGKKIRVIVKGIQYHITTYNILHLDFQELHDDVEVNIKIPLICTGVVDCVGIKLGGILRQVVSLVPIRVKPKEIPDQFELDIRDMVMGQSKRLEEVPVKDNIRLIMDKKEIVAVITKR